MPIKHIVLGGGGYLGLTTLGALHELHTNKIYHIDNITNIYSISIGALIGVILCLKIDWHIIIEYIKDRPWHKVITITPDMILNTLDKKGLLDNSFFHESLINLFKSVDLTAEITLQELFEYSQITLHIYSVKLNDMSLVDFNHKTHPNMKVIDAVYASSALPFIFQPFWYQDSYYLDGGLLNNYPLDLCIKNGGEHAEILGIKYTIAPEKKILRKEAKMMEFSFFIYKKFFRKLRQCQTYTITNEIHIPCDAINLQECKDLLEDSDKRGKFIQSGVQAAQLFLSYKK